MHKMPIKSLGNGRIFKQRNEINSKKNTHMEKYREDVSRNGP